MPVEGAHERIRQAVLEWTGVSAHAHRMGGTEFRLGRRELGHVHGDSLVDIGFPRNLRDQLVAQGRAEPHHVLPTSGWVSVFIREPADIQRAVELLRLSFDLARRHLAQQSSQAASPVASIVIRDAGRHEPHPPQGLLGL